MKCCTGVFLLLAWPILVKAVSLSKECAIEKLELQLQNGHPPVQVLASTSTYSSKSRINVTLQAKAGESIAGFRLMARSSKYGLQESSSRGLGTFLSTGSTGVHCGKDGMTSFLRTSKANKTISSFTITWVAPDKFVGSPPDVRFWAIFPQHHGTYWVPYESGIIHYKQVLKDVKMLIKDTCDDETRCFRYPEGCADKACEVIVGWQLDEDYVTFTATGLVSDTKRYLAIGFSPTGSMNPSPTVNCVRSASTSEVTIHTGHNADSSNKPLSPPTLGLNPRMSGEYVDGWLTCQFSYIKSKALIRSLTQHQSDEVLLADLTEELYYLIVARGNLDDQDMLDYHGYGDAHRIPSKIAVNFTKVAIPPVTTTLSVPISTPETPSVTEFRYPDGCEDSDCMVVLQWESVGEYVKFNMTGPLTKQENYLSFGFSENGKMFPSPTVDCLQMNTDISVKSGYNFAVGHRLQTPPDLGLHPDSSAQYEDGQMSCQFAYLVTDNSSDIANLQSTKYFLIFAKGAMTDEDTYTYHGANKIISKMAVDFTGEDMPPMVTTPGEPVTTPETPSTSQINTDNCGLTKSCFRYPANCGASVCQMVVTWKPQDDYVDFEVEMPAITQDYIAIGFSSAQDQMSPSPVVVCRFNSNGTFSILSTENKERSNNILNPPDLGLKSQGSSAGKIDERIVCRFSYLKTQATYADGGTTSMPQFTNTTYFLIMAKGPRGPSSSGIAHHTDRQSSIDAINFASPEYVNIGGVTGYPALVKAHGCLMVIAWMLFGGTGLLMSRYFKPVWPNTKVFGKHIWFVLHSSLMLTTFVLTVSGFIIIFVHVDGFSTLSGLPQSSHPILGIIVTSLVVLNPMLALMRCDPDSKHRWIFNWVHRLIGQGAFSGAAANILTAMYISMSGVGEDTKWVVIGYICLHVVTEIILLGLYYYNNKRSQKSHEFTQDSTESKPKIRWPETVVLIVYIMGALGWSLRLVIRIGANV